MNEEDIKDLVIARIEALPEDLKMSVGSKGDFSKAQLIDRIRSGDEVGKKIIDVQMKFLRSLKEGKLYESLYSTDAPQS